MATVIDKGGTDKTVVLGIREYVAQPFQAPEWLDLRVGWLLSVTAAGDDDDPTDSGIEEEIGTAQGVGQADRASIGLTDRETGTSFLGFTNRGNASRPITPGSSKLTTSDIGIGTTDANFWRLANGRINSWAVQIFDQSDSVRAEGRDGSQVHFAQNVGGAGGYATLLSLRFTRDNATDRARVITMTVKQSGHSGDVLFSNLPTTELLKTNLQSFPETVQQLGPVEMTHAPSAIFLYWPFRNSKLRIHAMGIVKAA